MKKEHELLELIAEWNTDDHAAAASEELARDWESKAKDAGKKSEEAAKEWATACAAAAWATADAGRKRTTVLGTRRALEEALEEALERAVKA